MKFATQTSDDSVNSGFKILLIGSQMLFQADNLPQMYALTFICTYRNQLIFIYITLFY